jgi:hypothetical protein
MQRNSSYTGLAMGSTRDLKIHVPAECQTGCGSFETHVKQTQSLDSRVSKYK